MQPIPSPPAPQPTLPCGLLNVNKPSGLTSRQVVNVVQRLARPAKAGHAGTLDPLATGVLVVCVGRRHAIDRVRAANAQAIHGDVPPRPAKPHGRRGRRGGRIARRARADAGRDRGGGPTFRRPDRAASAGLFGLEDSRPPGVQTRAARPTGCAAAPAGRHLSDRSQVVPLSRAGSGNRVRRWHVCPLAWAATWPNRWARRP